MAIRAWLLAGLLSWGAAAVAGVSSRETAAYIPAPLYFQTLVDEISRAKKSVTAYVYVFALRERGDALTFRLAEALEAAHRREVKVQVVLDQSGGYETAMAGRNNNDAAYRFLEARGVDVSFDAAPEVVHAKAVVIDGETVIAGSNNWSETAFTRNVEACLLVRDRKVAAEAWGWDRRLGLSVKAMYLLNRRYAESFSTRPRWSLSGETLTARHHVSDHVLSGGTTELRRANLVEVEYGELSRDGAAPRRPNTYTPDPFTTPPPWRRAGPPWIRLTGFHRETTSL